MSGLDTPFEAEADVLSQPAIAAYRMWQNERQAKLNRGGSNNV